MARARKMNGRKGGRSRTNGVGADQSGWSLQRRVPDCHRFVRRDLVPIDAGTAGAGVGVGLLFSLDQLPNYTDFTALFDTYSIDRVDIVVIPGSQSAQLYGAPDFDDSVAPTGLVDLLERQNCQVSVVGNSSYQQFRKSITPRMVITKTATTSPQHLPVGTQVDTADPSVPYFGYKLWLQSTNPTIATPYAGWQIIVTYHMRFWSAK